jgi:hypothetical protein
MTPCRFVDILGQQTQIVVTPNSSRVKTGPQHKSELIKYTDTEWIGDFDVIHFGQISAAFPTAVQTPLTGLRNDSLQYLPSNEASGFASNRGASVSKLLGIPTASETVIFIEPNNRFKKTKSLQAPNLTFSLKILMRNEPTIQA